MTRHVYKELFSFPFGHLAIIDFPQNPTAFDQYPSGRFMVGDMFDGHMVYYRLNLHASIINRGRNGDIDGILTKLRDTIRAYAYREFAQGIPVTGAKMLSDYLYWQLEPNGRIMGQSPGSKLVPLRGDRGFELAIEFPQLIFFKMEPRVTCQDPSDPTKQKVTFMAHAYEEAKEFITPSTVRCNYKRDGFFGKMLFDGRPYFFAMQAANLNRWNRPKQMHEANQSIERAFSNTMDPDTLSLLLHKEISKRFSFMRPGTIGTPKDIQVLFGMASQVNEDLALYPIAQDRM